MPAIHVRNVPDEVLAALRERARRHGQSMQEEVRQLLQAAASEPVPEEPVDPLRLHTVHVGGASTWSREDLYGDDGR